MQSSPSVENQLPPEQFIESKIWIYPSNIMQTLPKPNQQLGVIC